MAIASHRIVKFLSPKAVIGDPPAEFEEVTRLDAPPSVPSQLFWCSDANLPALERVVGGTVICSPEVFAHTTWQHLTYLIVDNPRLAFLRVLREFFEERPESRIESTASIDPTAVVGTGVAIGHHAVIEAGCLIGDGSVIGPNTVIHRKTVIGRNVKIGANNTIGGVGFGYEKAENGRYESIPHLGNVVIEDDVEIGNNTCVDRAPLGSTLLRRNAKIDNLVHIAHGCVIDQNALVIAHAMIGGSTWVGESAWIAPGALLKNGLKVGPRSVVGLGAVVVKSVEDDSVVMGNPARPK